MRVSARSANRRVLSGGFGLMLFVGGCMSPVDGPITDEEGNLFLDNPALGLDYADPMNTEYVPGMDADGGPA